MKSTAEKIRAYLSANADANVVDIARRFKVSAPYVYTLRSKMKRDSEPAPRVKVSDMVNHPAHYKSGGIETIDFIEAKELNYRLGNVVKYVTRADLKGDRLENLKKARWYLDREIEKSQTPQS